MRTTQFIGLNEEARNWIHLTVRKLPNMMCCPYCHRHFAISYAMDVRDASGRSVTGMSGEEIPLSDYTLCNGTVVHEVEDRVIWSSGPMIFTCLEIDGERLFEWTDKQLKEYGVGL